MNQNDLTIAVDLGGTNCRAAVVGVEGNIVRQIKREVNHDVSEPTIICDLINEVRGDSNIQKAVVGLPGIVDYELQKIVFYPNLPQEWKPFLTAPWISNKTGLEINLANDADLAGVGEAKFGAGRNFNDVVFVTISTGIGGAALLRGKLVHGKYAANDIGHIRINIDKSEDNSRSTPENCGSGPSLVHAAQEAGLDVDSKQLLDLVRQGDSIAKDVFETGIGGAAAGIVNLCWLYAPQMVIIGGGVGLNDDLVHPVVKDMLEKHGPTGIGKIEVKSAELGDSAALVGAAAWWSAVN